MSTTSWRQVAGGRCWITPRFNNVEMQALLDIFLGCTSSHNSSRICVVFTTTENALGNASVNASEAEGRIHAERIFCGGKGGEGRPTYWDQVWDQLSVVSSQ